MTNIKELPFQIPQIDGLKTSNCFLFARQMIRFMPGLKILEIYYNASGIVAEVEDLGANSSDERYYRMTLQPIDKPSKPL